MVENPTWKDIIEADLDQLVTYCERYDLPSRGNEESLRERLLRHILSITLPSTEIFLQGKVNINRATADEMRLWPYMGDTLIRNIIQYRKKYGKFYKVEDLLNVKGVGPNLFKKLLQFVDTTGSTHIKITNEISSDADLELIKLEDEIRQKAWELQDLQDRLNLSMEALGEIISSQEAEKGDLSKNIKNVERLRARFEKTEVQMEKLRGRLAREFKKLKNLSKRKREEINELKKQEMVLEQVLPWKFVLTSDLETLQGYCEKFELSPRGDEASLRDRLMRHILKIKVPMGEMFLEGKLNINTATPEEMNLWPYMGDTLIKNIIVHRTKYGRFRKVDDLLNVNGVGQNLFKKLVQFVDVSGRTHIKIIRESRAEADMELIRLEDDIRNKAWELQDLKERLDLDVESMTEIMDSTIEKESNLAEHLKDIEKFKGSLAKSEEQLHRLRARLDKEFKRLKVLSKRKREEIKELKEERIKLEQILPWKFIILSDHEALQHYCEEFGLSPRGDEASLRDRLMRHVLKINLPAGEFFLEGKLNINTATPEEMSMWPYMGNTTVKNIMEYRKKFGKFNKVEDLMNVSGVGENLFRKLVQFVDVSGKTHIRIKKEYRGDADMELIKLEDDIRNKAWELQDSKEHLDLDIDYLTELMRDLESERDTITSNLGDMEEFQTRLLLKEKELEGLRHTMEDQYERMRTMTDKQDEEFQKRLDELGTGQDDDLQQRLDDIARKEVFLKKRENDFEDRTKELQDIEERLKALARGVGASDNDYLVDTIDIPVIVQRDPDDDNPEDDRVILDSTDGYIRRVVNVYYEGQQQDANSSMVVFRDVPVQKSYNILVDTGERRYFLLKNYNPGGAS